jgi:hypothetical protein
MDRQHRVGEGALQIMSVKDQNPVKALAPS